MKYVRLAIITAIMMWCSVRPAGAICNNNPAECGGLLGCEPSTDQCVNGCCVAPDGGGTVPIGGGGDFS